MATFLTVSSVMGILTRHIKRVHNKKLNVINETRILFDNDDHKPHLQSSAKVGAPGLVHFVYCTCLLLLPKLSCSIHTTGSIDFGRSLYYSFNYQYQVEYLLV